MVYKEDKKHRNQRQNGRLSQITCLLLVILALTGCVTSESASLAPHPPRFNPYAPREAITEMAIEPASGSASGMEQQIASDEDIDETLALSQETVPEGCNVKDRFDRKAVLAYEWGGRNRVGFDVDGIGFDSLDVEQVKVQYRLRFQEYKTKKERCRYTSNWQGMIGSGYNELIERENDTVWQELKVIQKDAKNRWKTAFE